MENSLYFHSEEIDFALQNEERIASWLKKLTATEQKEIDELNYIFCTDEYLLEVNKTHLNHDYYTDVITFDYCEENQISGDIFISIDRVKENADTFNTTFEDELNRVLAHGVLHLMGYKDKTPEDEKKMREMEAFALDMLK